MRRIGGVWHAVNIASSMASTVLRLGAGVFATPVAKQPAQLLQLYEFEGCPHCRLVRDALTELDLDAMIYPCPKGGSRFRDIVIEQGGKAQFPYLVDPNTGVAMYESADIIKYLFATYAQCRLPWRWFAVELQRLSSSLAGIPRMGQGVRVKPSTAPDTPLELFSFESNPFARPVRDLLCEMEIPYVLRSSGVGTRKRATLLQRAGTVSLPTLFDPNTGSTTAGSAMIAGYLEDTYAASGAGG